MKNKIFQKILKMRNRHFFMLDFMILSLLPFISLAGRFESISHAMLFMRPLMIVTITWLFIKLSLFHLFRFYTRYWRYASVDEIGVLAVGTLSAWISCVAVFFLVLEPIGVIPSGFPHSIPFIDGILTMLLIGGIRFAIRIVYVLNERGEIKTGTKKVLIAGAGVAGSMVVKELRSNPQLGLEPIAFVDDDDDKQQMHIHGVIVMGRLKDITSIIMAKNIDEVIIAMPAVSGKVIRAVIETCSALNVVSKTVPGVFEIISGSTIAQLRDVSIDDLLRRDIVTVDEKNIEKLIKNACVMVTGAGGSIGSELCRQISRFHPRELILVGHGENSIFAIVNELKSIQGMSLRTTVRLTPVVADIRDRTRMGHVMEECRPQIIFHAAAHKHVGLMEENIADAVTNNVLGTQNMVELAAQHKVQKFVMISSDKAVNPMCVMGVTKRVAELVVVETAKRLECPFVVVRFGNVLGSRGSVVPIFKNQIAAGGPVTITHPDVTRYFMTIPEAVRLVLQAGALGTCGETFVLDMGQPIKIVELARDLIRLSGLEEGIDIDIKFTGLIDGEKMHEEIFYEHEHPRFSKHEKVFVCTNDPAKELTAVMSDASDPKTIEKSINMLREVDRERLAFKFNIDHLLIAARSGDALYTNNLLMKVIPQYNNRSLANQNKAVPSGRKMPTNATISLDTNSANGDHTIPIPKAHISPEPLPVIKKGAS